MIKISSKIWGFYLMFWRCPVSTYCIVSGSNMSGSNERTFQICQLLFTRLIFVVSCLLFCFCSRIFRSYGDVILVGKGLLDAHGLCTRRDLYRATPGVTRTSVFWGLNRRTALIKSSFTTRKCSKDQMNVFIFILLIYCKLVPKNDIYYINFQTQLQNWKHRILYNSKLIITACCKTLALFFRWSL